MSNCSTFFGIVTTRHGGPGVGNTRRRCGSITDPAELTETVAAFLLEEIRPEIQDPRLRFRLLIAANVLTIAARELHAGEAPLLAEWERLRDTLSKNEQTAPPAPKPCGKR